MTQKKWMMMAVVCIMVMLSLVACSNKEDSAPKSVKNGPSSVGKIEPKEAPPKTPQIVAPLTGLPVKDEAQSHRRVVGVMVNNYYLARPQSGLFKADIVFEALAEGNITRFLALFQSETPDVVGPVRSARPYYITLNNGYNGFYVAHGWSPQAEKILTSGKVDNINGMIYDGTLFHRVSFRKPPHNSYITFDKILKGAKLKNYSMTDNIEPLPFLKEDEVKAIAGTSISQVDIQYAKDNIVSYHYNDQKGVFDRYINGEVATDLETKAQLVAANVFIVEAKHRFIDSYPRRAINLTEGGRAFLLQKGKLLEVEWKNKDGRILPYKDGKYLGFVPGKTWVNIIPTDQGLEKVVTIHTDKE